MARQLVVLVAALVAAFVALPFSAHAGKYNLTRTVQSPLVAGHERPENTDCLTPGACFPVNQTIPGNSFWYWCGFWTTHKTIYTVTSTSNTTNFTGHWLMRRSVVESCVIPNLGTVENCPTIPESSCSKQRKCSVRLFGLVFSDDMCLVIINNKTSNVVATVQVNNWYSSSRYYGTVFTVFIAVVGFSAVLAKLAYDFYKNIIAPVNLHKEPIRPRRSRDLKEQLIDDTEKGRSAAVAGPDSSAPGGNFFGRLRSIFNRNKTAAVHD